MSETAPAVLPVSAVIAPLSAGTDNDRFNIRKARLSSFLEENDLTYESLAGDIAQSLREPAVAYIDAIVNDIKELQSFKPDYNLIELLIELQSLINVIEHLVKSHTPTPKSKVFGIHIEVRGYVVIEYL